jgi:hypothetical protein
MPIGIGRISKSCYPPETPQKYIDFWNQFEGQPIECYLEENDQSHPQWHCDSGGYVFVVTDRKVLEKVLEISPWFEGPFRTCRHMIEAGD